MLNFNFSYSTYNTYCESPLQFYFMKIVNAAETDQGMQVYGDAGNVVHKSGENFWNEKSHDFHQYWMEFKIDEQFGFRKTKLSKEKFQRMYESLVDYMINIKYDVAKTELEIFKPFIGMQFRAFIDLYTEVGDDIIIYDWKTNSTHDHNTHVKQRLLYSWLIWKIKGKIPLCRWVYLKNMDVIKERFTEAELFYFEKHDLLKFKADIEEKGDDISKYEAGNWKNPFNKYYTLCAEEVQKRQSAEYMEVHMAIKGNFVFLEGDVNPKLQEGIDFATKFDLPDKFWMQKEIKNKARGYVNLADVGTIHLYNTKYKCFPIGLLDKITKICNEFASYYNKKMKIFLHDKRDVGVMNFKQGVMPDKLITKYKFRPYQSEAKKIFMEKEAGVFEIAARGGKTFIAADIIREVDGKCIWLIDRIRLLKQTKKALEGFLGVKVGEISGDMVDIEGCSIIIASIQSVKSKLNSLIPFLQTINFCVVDEFHKSAAESYQKVFAKLANVRWRLGLTATARRTDGKEPILFSILGDIIYKITSKELVDLGYLVQPKIKFYKIKQYDLFSKTYKDDYDANVFHNEERNNMIVNTVSQNKEKKIMILTKLVQHGKDLVEKIPGSKHIYGTRKKNALIFQDFLDNKFKHLVITISKGGEGLDVPDLDMIINAAGQKSDVMTEQSGSRPLTLMEGKTEGHIIDFIDCGPHTKKHSQERISTYKNMGFEVEVIEE